MERDLWKDESSNILVVVRVRPLSNREKHSPGNQDILRVLNNRIVVALDPEADSDDFLRAKRSRERRYAFDYAFGPDAQQADLYSHSTKLLIDGVLNGYNATVFAYGATGAGKTYTMLGTHENPGMMSLTLEELFERVENLRYGERVKAEVSLSYLEVYNENIRDLLNPTSGHLDLREDPVKGPMVAGISTIKADSADEIMSLLRKGNKCRTQESTAANATSSRSHAVLQIVVRITDSSGDNARYGKLSLIDLAGSERAAATQNRGQRLIEGANINRSLLALGNCINALGDNKKREYINYRDSKLTRLLKDSLGGNCRTVMIANVSPASMWFEETLNTLKYANRAKNIKTKVARNVMTVDYHITEYVSLIAKLREEIGVLKSRIQSQAQSSCDPQPGDSGVGSMREALVSNFRKRMELRRALIDIQAQNVRNRVEISKREIILKQCEKSQNHEGDPNVPIDMNFLEMGKAEEDLEGLNDAIASNIEIQKKVEEALSINMGDNTRIREALQTQITNDERRELMELEYRIGVLELENMELEHSQMIREAILRQREASTAQLRSRLEARDRVIEVMKGFLTEDQLESGELADAIQYMEETDEIARANECLPDMTEQLLSPSQSGNGNDDPALTNNTADDMFGKTILGGFPAITSLKPDAPGGLSLQPPALSRMDILPNERLQSFGLLGSDKRRHSDAADISLNEEDEDDYHKTMVRGGSFGDRKTIKKLGNLSPPPSLKKRRAKTSIRTPGKGHKRHNMSSNTKMPFITPPSKPTFDLNTEPISSSRSVFSNAHTERQSHHQPNPSHFGFNNNNNNSFYSSPKHSNATKHSSPKQHHAPHPSNNHRNHHRQSSNNNHNNNLYDKVKSSNYGAAPYSRSTNNNRRNRSRHPKPAPQPHRSKNNNNNNNSNNSNNHNNGRSNRNRRHHNNNNNNIINDSNNPYNRGRKSYIGNGPVKVRSKAAAQVNSHHRQRHSNDLANSAGANANGVSNMLIAGSSKGTSVPVLPRMRKPAKIAPAAPMVPTTPHHHRGGFGQSSDGNASRLKSQSPNLALLGRGRSQHNGGGFRNRSRVRAPMGKIVSS